MMKKAVGKILLPLIALVCAVVLTSCAANPSETTVASTIPSVTAAEPTVLDQKLLGKWIEENNTIIFGLPYKSIEFFENGTSLIGEDEGTYQIVGGKLQCTFDEITYTGDYEINETKLTIYKADGQSKVYIKEGTAAVSDPKLLGKWVEEDTRIVFGLPYMSIEFFEDGTSLIGEDKGTYQIVNGQLQCTFDGVVYTGDYEINGTKLTIYKADGQSKVYNKEG